ncbi:MAG: hypothetical protein A3G33_04630 [Omnitrophica bacterium RIFCSPLOWO2_12_FULL_44_17]|uniref:Glycosyltransferase 2-like domain-containing protein n=1 Tax=Candidatus Danuiimicrobium aquiferis TaxID=1801832 RepID=A0A1G1KRP0_9BACT|nr:MAG: hypothetical protein A3B72_10840 [Omnitrophica bacterium RIFCSPHIGHO2_02_FULL_45_28]OGW95219.1 MAG: hypothetical protein A3G33_04630 [Omnitrophica bacterium RIFCSPLOWO2_12_FULL_44_17]OGX01636.1 MAG: hypothetical protein A3J12_03805 [Omnitrophica bacterium RIFCSPLOWO2_02_FULL_44_11]
MKFSIIIPVYNGLDFLKDAIDSVIEQTFSDYEIIIVDDFSEQDIEEFLKSNYSEFLAKQAVRYFRNSKRMERSFSRNCGVEYARGEILAFLDHDDCFKKNHLSEVYEAFLKYPDIELVYSVLEELIDYSNRVVSFSPHKFKDQDLIQAALQASFITSGISIKKKSFFRIGRFEERLTQREDYELLCRGLMECDLRVMLLWGNSIQVRRVKKPGRSSRKYIPDDPYLENTKLAKKIIGQYQFMHDCQKARHYLPYLYYEVANVSITYHDLSYAFRVILKLIMMKPFGFGYIKLVMRWLYHRLALEA